MPARSRALSYLYATLTQGGADAFVQASITTPFSGTESECGVIREVVIEWPRANIALGVNCELALTRKTQAAMPNITDKSLILKFKRYVELATNGAYSDPRGVQREAYTEEDNLLIVESTLYAQFDSAATTLTGTAYLRIGYTLQKISDVDRLTLIAQSLQA